MSLPSAGLEIKSRSMTAMRASARIPSGKRWAQNGVLWRRGRGAGTGEGSPAAKGFGAPDDVMSAGPGRTPDEAFAGAAGGTGMGAVGTVALEGTGTAGIGSADTADTGSG